MARPVYYDRNKIKIGWWNVAGRVDRCACCGRSVKKTCSLKITSDDGASVWGEFGEACAERIVAKYPPAKFVQSS